MEQAKIEKGFYIQGDLKFAVDAADAHKTFDAVAALSHDDKIKLAKLNDIPAEPYNKIALTNILKSAVQNAWFINKLGNLPAEVMSGHTARLNKYKAELLVPASTVDFLSRKTRATSSTARPSLMFTIDEAKYEADWNLAEKGKNWRGQRYLVVKTMLELSKTLEAGKGVTIRAIFDNTKETRETPQPTRNAVGQIVNALVSAGIATCLNPQDAKKKPEPAKTPEASTKKTPPAPPVKKKH